MNNPYKTTKTAQVVFGKDRSSGIDMLLSLGAPDKEVPGPGQYQHFTEFNNSRKLASSVLH